MGLLLLVSWTYPAEIFPLRIRAKAVSLSTATNWTFNCVLGGTLLLGVNESVDGFSSFQHTRSLLRFRPFRTRR
jgi:hypothetical protein